MTGETFAALEPGVYLVKSLTVEPKLMMKTRHGRLQTLDEQIKVTTVRARLIEWVRPLEAQGGLSGAMYWGDEIR